MNLQLFGINHKTSDVSERERFIIDESTHIFLENYLKDRFPNVLDSFFGLSTCNRTEFYFIADNDYINDIFNAVKHALGVENIPDSHFYFYKKEDAFIHMCKVACGVDSQVVGEQEIFGQFKSAYRTADDLGIIKNRLRQYVDKTLEISKKIRSSTKIGINPLSVSGLALNLVRKIFENPENQNVLIVGGGEMAKLIIESLYKSGIKNINAINRSIKVINISDTFNVIPMPLSHAHKALEDADIVIASATTAVPIIGKGAVESALRIRNNKPMLFIDLAVPRNIESEIKELEQVYLFSIDDIEKITKDNFGERLAEAEKASNLIVNEVLVAEKEINNKFKRNNIRKELRELLNSMSSKEISTFKTKIVNNENITDLILIKAKEIGASDSIRDIQLIDDHAIKEIMKGLIKDA
ncbi:glutamyl-tRNA reductase [Gammaproteobacteria bacterium]|jgi:glutamyl-tRNA reductase|nr:glutamyl-tRNA reductase [Gammaproteobacteria bacterium]MDB9996739.1 glutamyl-tRNA reductase [Gammaproteobacteria bacterium]|tara:strand:- start:925 stop:2160 length:1236 start_codon:yes stop_codon:yes gene_type:complete